MWSSPNLQLASAAARRGIPYLVTIHGMLDTWCMTKSTLRKRAFLALGGRRWLREAACIISTAEGEVAQTRHHHPDTRVEIIPAPMDLSEYESLPGPQAAEAALGNDLDTADPIVLFLSRIHPKKGLEVLIDAAAVLRDRGVRVRTIVAGGPDGPYRREMSARVERLDLGNLVRFVGPVAGETKRSLFQRAEVFALPTHQENFGIVFTESLACETPVVTTRGVDIWPELEASGGASIVERTPEAFADAIADIVGASERSAEMGASGRRWVLRYLDVHRVTDRFLEVYRSVSADRRETTA
jgi:glycosyltransferase involved in cell wall biosynthesis